MYMNIEVLVIVLISLLGLMNGSLWLKGISLQSEIDARVRLIRLQQEIIQELEDELACK